MTTASTPRRFLCALFFAGVMISPSAPQAAIGAAFTYQGRVAQSVTTVTGTLDFQFELYDALSGGNSVGGPVSLAGVTCTDGLFTVPLDFGAAAFAGGQRWPEIRVSPAFPGTPYTILTPRQELTPDPYAIFATAALNATTADHALTADDATNATNATNAANASNAELLDGIDSTGFALVGHAHPAGAITGVPATAVPFGGVSGIVGDPPKFSDDSVSSQFNVQPILSYADTEILTQRSTPSFSLGEIIHVHAWTDAGDYRYLGTRMLHERHAAKKISRTYLKENRCSA